MLTAQKIVNSLLETDFGPDDPDGIEQAMDQLFYDAEAEEQRVKDLLASGAVSDETVDKFSRFYSRKLTYKNSARHLEARRNGKTKRWKRRPGYFEVPVKYGLYEYFTITPDNADEWSTQPVPDKTKPVEKPRRNQASLPQNLIPPA